MPTQTFLNLPQKKRHRLIDAAIQEFSRVPVSDATISHIIKQAKIPRGSFYQYFADKFDLHHYIIGQFRTSWINQWRNFQIENHGNPFAAIRQLFPIILDDITSPQYYRFWQNTFITFRDHQMQPSQKKGHLAKKPILTTQNVALDHLAITADQLSLLQQELFATIFFGIRLYIMASYRGEEHPRQQTLDQFNTLISWLENGVVKRRDSYD
ncbi:TetR family transcriptional regulator [Ligilactobacillus sp. LYQ60]|uniref:TetR family transcriptional regulator n=1 Tax=unclassified Ligilactobacillus TaxID=2767920 RepID=UPI003851B50D